MGDFLRPVKHALTGLTAVLVAAGGLLLSTAAPAAAVPGPIEQRNARGVTADALPTAQINGVVWDQVVVGDIVYAGGSVHQRSAGGLAGGHATRRRAATCWPTTSAPASLVTGFAPTVNGQVKTLAVSPDKTRLYIGGTFTQVNGVNRYRIASFTVATGALTTFAAGPEHRRQRHRGDRHRGLRRRLVHQGRRGRPAAAGRLPPDHRRPARLGAVGRRHRARRSCPPRTARGSSWPAPSPT